MTARRTALLKGLVLLAVAGFAGFGAGNVYLAIEINRFYHHSVRTYDVVELTIPLVVMLGAMAGAGWFLFRAVRPRATG